MTIQTDEILSRCAAVADAVLERCRDRYGNEHTMYIIRSLRSPRLRVLGRAEGQRSGRPHYHRATGHRNRPAGHDDVTLHRDRSRFEEQPEVVARGAGDADQPVGGVPGYLRSMLLRQSGKLAS